MLCNDNEDDNEDDNKGDKRLDVWICCISATYGDLHTADGRFITVPVITFGIE
jgi:hypothetical protein